MVSGDQPSWNDHRENERHASGVVDNNPLDSFPSESIDQTERDHERTKNDWDYPDDYQDDRQLEMSSTQSDDSTTSSTREVDETTSVITKGI